jgi:endonuclease/exonuclease/phosphatase (EEP) superfamily protein YafD
LVGHLVWRAATVFGVLYAAVLILLSAVNLLIPQRHGLLSLSQILAPLLFLPLLLLVPLAFVRAAPGANGLRWRLRIGLLTCAVVAVVRFVPAWIPAASPRVPAGGLEIGVTTWNVEAEAPGPDAVVAALQGASPGIVAIEELATHTSTAIAADPALLQRFPYRVLVPNDGSLGVGLLSSYPFTGTPTAGLDPPLILARLDMGGGRVLDAVVTHPQPGQLRTFGPLPVDFDTSTRDLEIARIRSMVDPLISGGQPILLLGDFNTTDREPVYGDLSSGMRDIERAVGWGPGSTWRIDVLKWLPFGLLRIDMVFAGNGVVPESITPDCTSRGSDHCIVRATVTVP